MAAADRAVLEDRLFQPPGDNAFELYLEVLEAADGPEDAESTGRRRLLDSMADADPRVHARGVLNDLFPYGLVHVEQAIQSGRAEEAQRWIDLLSRVRANSPGLARVRDALLRPAARPQVAPAQAVPPRIDPPRSAVAAVQSPQPAVAFSPPGAGEGSGATPDTERPQRPSPRSGVDVAAAPAAATSAADISPVQAPVERVASALAPTTGAPEQRVQVAPRYPPRARRQRIEGWVAVRFRVAADGQVSDVSVVAAEPEGIFDREAVGAVSRWQFEASSEDHWLERRIDFMLDR